MKNQFDVIALGEILADFVPEGKGYVLRPGPAKTASSKVASQPLDGSPSAGQQEMKYVLRPGGAPANVAVNLSRTGVKSAVIGRLGHDFIGDFLHDFLKKNKVDISMVSRDKHAKTGLVFVFLNKYKDRDFSFYGEPSADKFLAADDIKDVFIKKCRILHFGSISMMAKSSAAATLKAIRLAKKHGKLISFDPNVRLNLWEGKAEQAKRKIRGYFKYADIIKISDTELKFLFNAVPSAKALGRIFGKKLVFVSAGAEGCFLYYKGFFRHVPGFRAEVIDSTGAGDAFMAGVLRGVIKANNDLNLSKTDLVNIAKAANKCGSKAVTRKGAV